MSTAVPASRQISRSMGWRLLSLLSLYLLPFFRFVWSTHALPIYLFSRLETHAFPFTLFFSTLVPPRSLLAVNAHTCISLQLFLQSIFNSGYSFGYFYFTVLLFLFPAIPLSRYTSGSFVNSFSSLLVCFVFQSSILPLYTFWLPFFFASFLYYPFCLRAGSQKSRSFSFPTLLFSLTI